MTPKKTKKTEQKSFRVEPELAKGLLGAAIREERSEADFLRLLFKWTFEHYKKAGSLDALRDRYELRKRKVPTSRHRGK